MASLGEALDYTMGSLDKPGRAVRGLLYGKPREALAALPFSDTLGITDPHEAVSGRQLSDKLGLTNPGDDGWGAWGVGQATSMATDPLAWIPGHMAAKALGKTGLGAALARGMHRFHADESGALKLITPSDYWKMAASEDNPLGRLHALAESAGAEVFPAVGGRERFERLARGAGKSLDDEFEDMIRFSLSRANSEKPLAIFSGHGGSRKITPNVLDYPDLWSDLGAMTDEARRMHGIGWHSTPMPEHAAVHEIGHALHHGTPGAAHIEWPFELPSAVRSQIQGQSSIYSTANPLEFAAEAFAKRAHSDVTGRPWLSGMPEQMYRTFDGPAVPGGLLAKLREYGVGRQS